MRKTLSTQCPAVCVFLNFFWHPNWQNSMCALSVGALRMPSVTGFSLHVFSVKLPCMCRVSWWVRYVHECRHNHHLSPGLVPFTGSHGFSGDLPATHAFISVVKRASLKNHCYFSRSQLERVYCDPFPLWRAESKKSARGPSPRCAGVSTLGDSVLVGTVMCLPHFKLNPDI